MQRQQNSLYQSTSKDLDGAVSTISTLVPIGLTFALINNDSFSLFTTWLSWLLILGLSVLLFHFLSYATAHYAQIYLLKLNTNKKDQNNLKLYERYGEWTHLINRGVYIGIILQIIGVIWVVALLFS